MATRHAEHIPNRRKPAIAGAGRQAVEGNPLTPDEVEMFEMFERERWSPERRRAHILALVSTQ